MDQLVSFVIPSHNCSEFLGPAVESVRNQTYKNLEIIIIDDNSTDTTKQYLDWLLKVEPRAKILINTSRMGRSASRNRGNLFANGKYIFVLDADDLCYPNRVDVTLPLFKKANFAHGGAVNISALNEELGPLPTDKFSMDRTKADPIKQSFIVHSTVAYTKDIAISIPYRDGDIADLGIDDWDQQIRVAMEGEKFNFTPRYLSFYRNRPGNITTKRKQIDVMGKKKELFPELFLEKVA